MYKKIIAALNPSNLDHGADILQAANRLLDDGGEIVALSVIEEIPDYVASQLPAGLVHEAAKRTHKALDALIERTGVPAQVLVETGHAWRTICEEADRRGADLVVMWPHRPGLTDMILGSTATHVVRHCECSVLVLR